MQNTPTTNTNIIALINQIMQAKKISKQQLAEHLQIGKSVFYNRLNGNGEFLFTEVESLCDLAGISMDDLRGNSSTQKIFNVKKFPVLSTPAETFETYINALYTDLQLVKQAGLQQIYYAAKDLPLFCFFSSPILTAFKLYFWNNTIFHTTDRHQKFNPTWLPANIIAKATELYNTYLQCNTLEIWNLETINSTIHQLAYCKRADIITDKDYKEIIHQLTLFIEQLFTNCIHGQKPQGGKLIMYFNEILLLDNSVLFDLGPTKVFYLPYQTLNFLSTTNIQITEESVNWFKKQKAKSHLISEDGEEQRERLLNHYLQEIKKINQ
jgi:hypothetical protein